MDGVLQFVNRVEDDSPTFAEIETMFSSSSSGEENENGTAATAGASGNNVNVTGAAPARTSNGGTVGAAINFYEGATTTVGTIAVPSTSSTGGAAPSTQRQFTSEGDRRQQTGAESRHDRSRSKEESGEAIGHLSSGNGRGSLVRRSSAGLASRRPSMEERELVGKMRHSLDKGTFGMERVGREGGRRRSRTRLSIPVDVGSLGGEDKPSSPPSYRGSSSGADSASPRRSKKTVPHSKSPSQQTPDAPPTSAFDKHFAPTEFFTGAKSTSAARGAASSSGAGGGPGTNAPQPTSCFNHCDVTFMREVCEGPMALGIQIGQMAARMQRGRSQNEAIRTLVGALSVAQDVLGGGVVADNCQQ